MIDLLSGLGFIDHRIMNRSDNSLIMVLPKKRARRQVRANIFTIFSAIIDVNITRKSKKEVLTDSELKSILSCQVKNYPTEHGNYS